MKGGTQFLAFAAPVFLIRTGKAKSVFSAPCQTEPLISDLFCSTVESIKCIYAVKYNFSYSMLYNCYKKKKVLKCLFLDLH